MTQWPPPMPPGLAWFLAIYSAVGATIVFNESIRAVYKRWRRKRRDVWLKLKTQNLFPRYTMWPRGAWTQEDFQRAHRYVDDRTAFAKEYLRTDTDAPREGLFTADQLDELKAEAAELDARYALKVAEPDEWGALWFNFETKRWRAAYLPAYPVQIGCHPAPVEWLMISDYRKIMEQVHHYKYWDLRTLKWVYWNWATKEWE